MSGLMPRRQAFPFKLRSSVAEIGWPSLLRGPAAATVALLREIEDAQWLPAEEIVLAQHGQLVVLARFAARHSRHFAERLKEAGLVPEDLATPAGLARLPILRRRDIQRRGSDLYCAEIPPGHQPLGESKTSGSTGEPVLIRRTAVSRLFFQAMNLRDHVWHGRDLARPFSAIRPQVSSYAVNKDWGEPVSSVVETGPLQAIPMTLDAARQVELLREFRPYCLIVYPNSLDAIAAYCEGQEIGLPGLAKIRTIGETLSPRVRERARKVLSAELADHYSSQEVGSIAIECPESGLYHVMAESVIVEVVDDQGRPCGEGGTGRVLVTDLHNFAMPIVRYEIGDYAEVAGPCPCGRGLPAFKAILGRERNLILMPDGSRHWPLVGFHAYRDIAPVSQYQFIQHDRERIEVRLVMEAPMTEAQEAKLKDHMLKSLGHPFDLAFTYFPNSLPRAKGGKFEEFVCLANPS